LLVRTTGAEPPWAAYRFSQAVVPSVELHPFHVHNLGVTEMLFAARNSYVADAVGVGWRDLSRSGRNMVMRRLEIDFESEVSAGIALKVGVRAATRSRRTLTFEEAVWRTDTGDAVAVARSVHLLVLLDAPGAIDLPDDVVEGFESFEGRPLPFAARA
jgi:acyl-CoA thioesterase FadM